MPQGPATTIAVVLAIIGLIQVVTIPLLNAWVIARKERRDYARQDVVAASLAKAQRDAIVRTDEVARIAAESDRRISEKLDQGIEQGRKIHILVNSDMTAARTAERDAAARLVVLMKQVRAAHILAGIPVDELDGEIEAGEARVEELNQILADRLAAQQKVDSEAG